MASSPRLYSIFDTNGYVNIDRPRLQEMRDAERRAGVESLSSAIPCMETLAHCARLDDPRHARSLATLSKIWLHTGYMGGDGPRIRMYEDAETTLARGLFGITPPNHWGTTEIIAEIIRDSVNNPKTFAQTYREDLNAIAKHIEEKESAFAKSVGEIAALARMHGRQGFRDALRANGIDLAAKTRVETMAQILGISVSPEEVAEMAQRVAAEFPVAMCFLRDLLLDLIVSTMDMTKSKNSNSHWDLQIVFHASTGGAVQGTPVLVVTNERRIKRAAISAQVPHRTATTAEYLAMLASDEQLQNRIELLKRS